MNELRAENLHLWRGEQHVLRGLTFTVQGGQCLQVTGANGAGKTTLLRALCALTPLEEGSIHWCGRRIHEDLAAFHAELGYLGHDNGLKADLSVTENLRYAVQLRRRLSAAQIATVLEHVGLAGAAAQLLRTLSAGQRRRAALARLALAGGSLWVLDEPGSNLDAAGQELVRELLERHLRDGGTAIVATHQPLGLVAPQLCSLALQ